MNNTTTKESKRPNKYIIESNLTFRTKIKENNRPKYIPTSGKYKNTKPRPKKTELSPSSPYYLFCLSRRKIFKGNEEERFLSNILGRMPNDSSSDENDENKKEYSNSSHKNDLDDSEKVISSSEDEDDSDESKKINTKRKAKTSEASQRKNNMKACNCGRCLECQKRNHRLGDSEDSDE